VANGSHNLNLGATSSDVAFNPSAYNPSGLSLAEPSDFFALMKPRVMSLVVFTAWAGLVCAPGVLPLWKAIASIICIAAGAGASGALNMWYDADIDAKMSRTKKRPIPQGKMSPSAALGFGVIISIASVWMLYIASNMVAAALLAFTIFFYLIIYTMWLKRSTPQNIVIGGLAGAAPPLLGWVAVTGEVHPYSLCPKSTRNQIMAYSVMLAAIAIAPIFTGLGGPIFAVFSVALNLAFLALAFKVWKSRAGETAGSSDEASLYAVKSGDHAARNLFAFSIIYLFAIFGVLALETVLKGLI